ncbi:MAG: GHMP family kinase ATP-binding protein [Planctomycetota bacterium]|jgi:N-acetylgalactosamine kinase
MNPADTKGIAGQTVVVVLAAGKGTRMGRRDLGKVRFEIDSVPAINRQIRVFKRRGFHGFLIVLGSKAEQILDTVAEEHPGIIYVYQEPQLGTGHAAKIAADALANIRFDGHVLVTMGDKLVERPAIDALVTGYIKQRADLALLTTPIGKATAGSVGRVFVDNSGQALDIIEKTDRARQAIVDDLKKRLARAKTLKGPTLLEVIGRHISQPDKQAVAVPELVALAADGNRVDRAKLRRILDSEQYNLRVDGRRYSARQIERLCQRANPSFYLFRSQAFYEGVGMIDNENAQGEYYLTDVVRLLGSSKGDDGKSRFRVRAVPVDNPDWIQGYNSPDELLAIQDYVRRKKTQRREALGLDGPPRLKPRQYGTVRNWLAKIEARKPGVGRWLRRIYGDHEALHRQKCKDLTGVLRCYAKRFGADEKVCIVRAPGRLNLMGRHVDHRGGWTNFLAIDRETLAVVGLREDDQVLAVNAEPKRFKPVEFGISQLIGRFAWSEWLNFVRSDWVREMVYHAGHWGNYIKAAVLRLQHGYQDVKIRGINVALMGNVPAAAGLGSGATILVAILQAAIALNNFELTSRQFIDLCGEGEWFVGSRGGPGDHAAVYLGQRGKIAHVGYLPFRVEKMIDSPRDYRLLIADSHIKTPRHEAAENVRNQRLAAYDLGLALLKRRCPQIAHAVEHLRDLDPARLGCTTSDVYRFLLKVPERMGRGDFKAMLSSREQDLMEAHFATHPEPRCYYPRAVLLYGASEIARSRLCAGCVEDGRIQSLGTLMKVSHDGDRVSKPGPAGEYRPWRHDSSDPFLNRLIDDLASEDPQRVQRAQLYMQPGGYACSTPEIDRMVDAAAAAPGVAGAQIAGAGLGGCIMILANKESVDAVRKTLTRDFYRPAGLKPAVFPCVTVEGAGLVEF